MAARAYLDWAAGAPLHPAAADAVSRVLALGVGNPSSIHAEGRAARAILEEARGQVASLVGCDPTEVIFTSSGSEANAAAVLGAAAAGRLVAAGAIEHASVRLAAAMAARSGVRVDELPCGTDGRYDVDVAGRIFAEPRPRFAGGIPGAPEEGGADTRWSGREDRGEVGNTQSGSRGLTEEVRGEGAASTNGRRGTSGAPARPDRSASGPAGGLLAVQLANNETGALQPIEELSGLARDWAFDLHVDAVQAAGKVDLAPIWARCSSLSLSAHKLGGLAGAGALCLRRGSVLLPRIPGHQERGLRGGTHGLGAIAAFGAVAAAAARELEARAAKLAALGERLESIVRMTDGRARIQAHGAPRVPGIVSATFPGADGETLLVALDLSGVAAAHGAACSTGAMEPSHVLLAMGLSPSEARSTVRFSVGPGTADEELDRLERVLPDALRAARLG